MKKSILILVALLAIATPAMALENGVLDHTHSQYVEDAGGDEGQLAAIGAVVSGATMYGLNSANGDNGFQNFLTSVAFGSAIAMAQADDSAEQTAAVAGALLGTMTGQYIWLKVNEDTTMAGFSVVW